MRMNSFAKTPTLRFFLPALVFATSLISLSLAHDQKTALTDIFYNERTGNLEVAHRITLHDAEDTLHKVTDSKADLAVSLEAQAAFANYVAKRFDLKLEDGKSLPLTLVGQELEDGYLWVYQETKIPEPAKTSFIIENAILQDAVKGQINTVNVRYRSRVSTFVFEAGTGRQLYEGPAGSESKE